MTHDLSVCNQIVDNLYYDVMLQLVLLILIIVLQIGIIAGLIIYAYTHRS